MNELRRHAWSRPGLEGRRACPFSTNCSISQPLALGTHQGEIGPCMIINPQLGPVGIAEVEFSQVSVKMRLADMEVAAVNAPLQDREKALDRVGVNVVPHVFLGAVVHGFVPGVGPTDVVIDVGLVTDKATVAMGVPRDDWIEVGRGHAWDMEAADLAAALNQGHDGEFRRDRVISPVRCFAAHVGFVGFDGRASPTHGFRKRPRWRLHAFSHAMAEEPGGLHTAFKGPLDLPGREALLGRVHEVDDLEPDMQGHMAGLEDGPHTDGERLPTGVALPKPRPIALPIQPTGPVHRAALWTNGAIRPEFRLDVGESGGFALELGGGYGGLHGGYLLNHQSTGGVGHVKCNFAGIGV